MTDETNTGNGANRRDLFKGAAGLAVGAAAMSMIPSRVASAMETGFSASIGDLGPFQVLAYSWGASNAVATSGTGRAAARADFQDISMTKFTGAESPRLFEFLATGRVVPKGSLTIAPTNGLIQMYDLTDLIVTSVSTGGSGGEDRLTENVSIRFRAFKYTAGDQSFAWNIASNSPA